MSGELLKYGSGAQYAPLRDRKAARESKETYDQVRLAALKADGTRALAGYMMEGVVELDALRQSLTRGDAVTAMLLIDIEQNAIRSMKHIQDRLFNEWGL